MNFQEMNLDENIIEAINYMGFDQPTEIQEFAIPNIIAGHDLIACAQTGTGKTAAFVLPILHQIIQTQNQSTSTLIIVPTRELAIQIDQQIQGFSYFLNIGSIAIYGGGDGIIYAEQERALKNGRNIIIATPGRLISHLAQGYVNFKHIKHLVLDEADKMLNMGFLDDIEKIISFLPKERQTLLFSATMPPKIRSLAKKILRQPKEISLSISKPAEGVNQNVILCYEEQKQPVLLHILNQYQAYTSIIIFTSQKRKVNEIVQFLRSKKITAAGISSDLEQNIREEVIIKFRAKNLRVLVATDVMSRGIDIKNIEMVINYDAPQDAEDYVHRIGRTARANSKGDAFTLISPRDMLRIKNIEDLIEMQIPRLPLPEEFGEAPIWKIEEKQPKKRFYKKSKSKSKNATHRNSQHNKR